MEGEGKEKRFYFRLKLDNGISERALGLSQGEEKMVASANSDRTAADRSTDRDRWCFACGAFCLYPVLNHDERRTERAIQGAAGPLRRIWTDRMAYT